MTSTVTDEMVEAGQRALQEGYDFLIPKKVIRTVLDAALAVDPSRRPVAGGAVEAALVTWFGMTNWPGIFGHKEVHEQRMGAVLSADRARRVAELAPKRHGIYVASRASVPERSAMWRQFRECGVQINSSWIDESWKGETSDFSELWTRIHSEIARSEMLILYAETNDFPLKGALIEAGIAIGMGIPVRIVLPGVQLEERTDRPIGSWIRHDLVERFDTVTVAVEQPIRTEIPAPPSWAQSPERRSDDTAPRDAAAKTSTDRPEYRLGNVIWHSSDDDGGPDIGISIGLGNGKSIWVGEISKDVHAEGGEEAKALGDDSGWWLMLYPDRLPLAKFVDTQSAREFSDEIERVVFLAAKNPDVAAQAGNADRTLLRALTYAVADLLQTRGLPDDDPREQTLLHLATQTFGDAWTLSAVDSVAFVDALENPPEPNEALKQAAEHYRARRAPDPPPFPPWSAEMAAVVRETAAWVNEYLPGKMVSHPLQEYLDVAFPETFDANR